jgi:nitroreductase
MEVLEAIKSGKSASKFKPTPVPEQKIQAVFNAARLAPSAENLQPWRFIVVNDEDLKKQVKAACTNAKRIGDAPLVVVACARMDEAVAMIGGYMNSYPVDVGMALSHLSLAATSEGLGTSWVFAFNEEKVKAALGIPDDAKVVGLSPLGYPEALEPPEGRKHLSEILSYNGYE